MVLRLQHHIHIGDVVDGVTALFGAVASSPAQSAAASGGFLYLPEQSKQQHDDFGIFKVTKYRSFASYYELAILHASKWILTAVLFVSAFILILACIDLMAPIFAGAYDWRTVMWGIFMMILSYTIRRMIVRRLTSIRKETNF